MPTDDQLRTCYLYQCRLVELGWQMRRIQQVPGGEVIMIWIPREPTAASTEPLIVTVLNNGSIV